MLIGTLCAYMQIVYRYAFCREASVGIRRGYESIEFFSVYMSSICVILEWPNMEQMEDKTMKLDKKIIQEQEKNKRMHRLHTDAIRLIRILTDELRSSTLGPTSGVSEVMHFDLRFRCLRARIKEMRVLADGRSGWTARIDDLEDLLKVLERAHLRY